MSEEALALRAPVLKAIPRITERLPFLSIDRMRVEQTRTGIEGVLNIPDEGLLRIPIPFANIAAIIMGPGTSITTPAAITLHRHGTVMIFGSADGITGYASARPLTTSSKWAVAQARTCSLNEYRVPAAKRLYLARFVDSEIPEEITIRQLRGMEGRIVRQSYLFLAKQHGISKFTRDTKSDDQVNVALNIGNSILYGVALSVVSALSLNPSLGVIHSGSSGAFLFDLADAFKLTTTVPIAFGLHDTDKDELPKIVSKKVRESFDKNDVLQKMFDLTVRILTPGIREAGEDDILFDPEGNVAGHTNWELE